MSEPDLQPFAVAAASQQERLWDRAPGWRNLTLLALFLTLAAVATPLLVPQHADESLSTQAAPSSHIAAASSYNTPTTPKATIALPLNSSAQMASLGPQAVTEAMSRPATSSRHHAATPTPSIASLPPQPEPGGPTQPAAGAANTAAPPADLANLPLGTEIVPSGVLTRVNRHNRYTQQLGGDLPVTITIISPPTHGTVSTQEGTAPLTFPNAGVTRIASVTNVFYQSAPGYVGQDSFTYKRTSTDPNDPLNARTYTVTIYAQSSPAQ